MKDKFVKLYMDWASRTAQLSHAVRLQVGAVIVKDDTVISYGYNGMPAGWDNDCEYKHYKIDGYLVDDDGCYELKTKPEVLHAESNAVAKLAKSINSGNGADIFITHAPCLDCAKLVYQAGIRRVYFSTAYRDDSGVRFLEKSGVTVTQIKE
jgi:dCMP deaminase